MAVEGGGDGLGEKKRIPNEHELVYKLLDQAKNSEHENFDNEQDDSKEKKAPFRGIAYKLSNDDGHADEPTTPAITRQKVDKRETITRRITFWKSAFTIAGQDKVYPYDDPENQKILKQLQSGMVPFGLLNVKPGDSVDLQIDQRIHEEYQKPSSQNTAPVPFSGKGNRLGDLASSIQPPAAATTGTVIRKDDQKNLYDATKAHTKIQIRLANGNRHSITVNNEQTIVELYEIVSSLSAASSAQFILLSGTPLVKLASDDQRSIQDASLLNSVVIQQTN